MVFLWAEPIAWHYALVMAVAAILGGVAGASVGKRIPKVVTGNFGGSSLSVLINQSQPTTLELIAPDGVTVLATATATSEIAAR